MDGIMVIKIASYSDIFIGSISIILFVTNINIARLWPNQCREIWVIQQSN